MRFLRKVKQEKGSITMTVVAAMLFITSSILIAYFSLSNQSNDQSKKIRQIADSYKVTNSELVQKYKDVQDGLVDNDDGESESDTIIITAGQKAPANSNAQYKSGNYTAIIPAGFTVSNLAGETDIQTGLVIRDDDGNEFVWIPVGIPWKSDPTKTITLSRYTFDENGIPTDQGANAIEDENGYTYTELASSSYGNAVAKTDVTSADGFIAKTNAAGGFWIGRYEARVENWSDEIENNENYESSWTRYTGGNLVEKPTAQVFNYITQNKASEISRNMYSTNNYFECDLMNSYAWDTATLFLQEYDNREGTNLTPYSMQNSIINDYLLESGTVTETNKDKICNVYDMASNCTEFTTETYTGEDYFPCVMRGGVYLSSSAHTSARYDEDFACGGDYNSFRPILYIK